MQLQDTEVKKNKTYEKDFIPQHRRSKKIEEKNELINF